MNRTSPSSSLVRIAARSPARSSAGPDVMCRCTPISAATMPAMLVLPRPGGPASSRWSAAWPRRRAASRTIARCSLSSRWPTNSASRRGRSPASSGLARRRRRRRCRAARHARLAPSSFNASRSSVAASPPDGSSRSASRISSGRSRARRAPRARRRPTPPAATAADRFEDRQVEPVAQLDQQPLGGLLADAGHERQRGEVAGGDDVDERRRRVRGEDRHRHRRARRRGWRSAPGTSAARRAGGTRTASGRPRGCGGGRGGTPSSSAPARPACAA